MHHKTDERKKKKKSNIHLAINSLQLQTYRRIEWWDFSILTRVNRLWLIGIYNSIFFFLVIFFLNKKKAAPPCPMPKLLFFLIYPVRWRCRMLYIQRVLWSNSFYRLLILCRTELKQSFFDLHKIWKIKEEKKKWNDNNEESAYGRLRRHHTKCEREHSLSRVEMK